MSTTSPTPLKPTTIREAQLEISRALDVLINKGAEISPETAEILELTFLNGCQWARDQIHRERFTKWKLKENQGEIPPLIRNMISKLHAADHQIPEEAAITLERWFESGAKWLETHEFLERDRESSLILPH